MALILKDRVKESATSPGTGSVTLLGASVGFQSFSVIGNGNTCYYTISDQGGPNWEVGIGTYSTTGPTLARTTVLASSNAGSLTNFNAGTQDVFVTYPSERGVWLDASGNAIGLGTPAAFVGTNITGTASGLTAGTVTTNANLTGPITSVGNATSIASQTGTGTKFVMDTSPTITGATLTTAALNGTLGATTPSTVVATTGSFTGPTPTGSALAVRTTGGDAVSITTRATGLGGVISATDTTLATYANLDIICNGAYIKANNGATVLTISSTGLAVTGNLSATGTLTGITDLTTTGNTILGNASTDTLNVGNGDLIKDASGNLGLGATPTAVSTYRVLELNGASGGYLSFHNAGTEYGNVYGNASGVSLTATGALNASIWTNSTERMRIDSSGNVGIGVTPSAWYGVNGAIELQNGGAIATKGAYSYNAANAYFQSGWKYSTSVGGATLYTQTNGAHTWSQSPAGTAGNAITFTQAMTLDASGGLQTLNTIGVGNATPSASGAGITFPATQSASTDANTLDDYEEGTWTVTLTPATSGSITMNTSFDLAAYTKIGNTVFVQSQIVVSSVSSPVGTIVKLSLPFAIADLGEISGRFGTVVQSDSSGAVLNYPAVATEGDSFISVYITAAIIAAGNSFYFNFAY